MHGARAHADEAVGGPLLAADHALQQERIGAATELGVGGDGRVGVGHHLAVHEGQATPAGKVKKGCAVWDTLGHRNRIIYHGFRASPVDTRYIPPPVPPPFAVPSLPAAPAVPPAARRTQRYVGWTVRYGGWLWLAALLLAVPAAWRTARLYANLRSDVEELLPRDAPSVKSIDELRARMPGLQFLGGAGRRRDRRLPGADAGGGKVHR